MLKMTKKQKRQLIERIDARIAELQFLQEVQVKDKNKLQQLIYDLSIFRVTI